MYNIVYVIWRFLTLSLMSLFVTSRYNFNIKEFIICRG